MFGECIEDLIIYSMNQFVKDDGDVLDLGIESCEN